MSKMFYKTMTAKTIKEQEEMNRSPWEVYKKAEQEKHYALVKLRELKKNLKEADISLTVAYINAKKHSNILTEDMYFNAIRELGKISEDTSRIIKEIEESQTDFSRGEFVW